MIYSRVRNSALSCNSVPQSIAAGCAQLLLLWGLLVPATAAPSQPHPAVARIIVAERDGTAFGSGTLVDVRDGYGLVLTNWHVVRDATGSIEVLFPGGFYSQARALKLDRDWDLAALVVWRPPAEPVPLASRPPQPGDRLTIAGYGRGTYRQVSGRCTRYYSPKVHLPKELVELDVEARQGDSGGPIFNDRGELAGVLFGAGRGTTIGSFQGRVKTFLASLAPDIGVPRADSAPQVALAPIESAAPARESSELSRGRLLAARPVETRPIDTRSAAEFSAAPAAGDDWVAAAGPEVPAAPAAQPQLHPANDTASLPAIDWQLARNVLAAIGVLSVLLQFIKWAG